MKSFIFTCFVLLFFACTNKADKNVLNENLFANKEIIPEFVDSIQTKTAKPFLPVDTFDFSTNTFYEFDEVKIPLKTSNLYSANDSITRSFKPLIANYIDTPNVVEAIPYLAPIIYPNPIKAGEFRRTGQGNENIQYLDVEQGLPSPIVNAIVEDPYGFMWFGTNGGLIRYDGNYFYHFTTKNNLPHNYITDLCFDANGNFWIGTVKGLVKFNGHYFEIFDASNGLLEDEPSCFRLDDAGNFWFCDGGVTKYDGKTFRHYTEKDGLHGQALEISFDKHKRLYVNCFDNPPVFIKGDTVYTIQENKSDARYIFGSNIQLDVITDKDGYLWMANYNYGISKIDDSNKVHTYKPKSGLPMASINSIIQDKNGHMWCASIEGGVMKWVDTTFIAYTTDQGLNSNYATELYEDSKGNIWVGTLGGGVNKIIPNSFRTFDETDGSSSKMIDNVNIDSKGRKIFGSWADGIWMFDDAVWTRPSAHLHWQIVYDVEEDYFGNSFAGIHMHGTFYLIKKEGDSSYFSGAYNLNDNPDFKSFGVRKIEFDSSGAVWLFDDSHGIYNIQLNEDKTAYGKVYHYTTESGLLSNSIQYAFKDDKGRFWTTDQTNGISCIDGNEITYFTMKDGLLSNTVTTIYGYGEAIWIGTSNGLNIYENGEFKSITMKDGLSFSSIRSIIRDKYERYWVATTNGLNILEKDDSKECGYSIVQVSIQDGLKSTEFMTHTVDIDSNDMIWWSTRKGLAKLDINKYLTVSELPKTELMQIELMNQYVSFSSLYDSIALNKNYYSSDSLRNFANVAFDSIMPFFDIPINLELPHNINNLNFKFSVAPKFPSHQIKYRYRLLGLDNNWMNETKNPEAKYSNLSYGAYQFEVQTKIGSGDFGPVTTYAFVIHPPFWHTWWFRILVFSALILIIYLIFKWRNKALIERQIQLETTVNERTQEIQHQKTVIEQKQIEILDSINYAQRIQRSLLASKELLDSNLKSNERERDYFIFFQPKDIVSGDFYWASKLNNDNFLLLTADSTGHGVPGAIMSMLNISSIEKAIDSKKLVEPADILNYTRKKIIETLAKDGSAEGGKDGMDCSLLSFDFENKKITFSGANNGIWIIRPSTGTGLVGFSFELLEFTPDKMPCGKHDKDSISFSQQTIELKKGDIIYTFTDGMPDQFGGDKGKKFKYKSLKKLLLDNAHLSMNEQEKNLRESFFKWKGDLEQVDDICVIGIRL